MGIQRLARHMDLGLVEKMEADWRAWQQASVRESSSEPKTSRARRAETYRANGRKGPYKGRTEPRLVPYENRSKTYAANGKRECARRGRQLMEQELKALERSGYKPAA